MAQVPRLVQGVYAHQQRRAAHGGDGIVEEFLSGDAGIISMTEADGDINLVPAEIDQLHARRNAHVQIRVCLGEPFEAGNQPLGGERRWQADGDDAGTVLTGQSLHGFGHAVQSLGQSRQTLLSGASQ